MPRIVLRVRALLESRGWSASELHRQSRKRISLSTAHRLARGGDEVKALSLALIGVLCETLDVEPGDLLARDGKPPRGPR